MRKKKKDLIKDQKKYQKHQILDVPIDQIIPNPNQPRQVFDSEALKELAESIETYGVIQPIQVRRLDTNLYELVSGERRLRASKLAKQKTIPAIVVSINDQDSAVLAIIENVQREDLNYFEEAESYQQLIKYYHMTQGQVAKLIGKSQSFVANKLRLIKMDDEVIQTIKEAGLSERHARALLKVPDKDIQIEVIHQIKKKDLNVKKTEKLVEKIRNEVLVNNYDEKITPGKKARVKSFINAQIYLNTIKSAFKEIQRTKQDAQYREKEKEDKIVVTITIPK
ncbi:ParB/RepB/Spo0J family partition protein [Pseudoramibacter sp.]|uniref:ParB/RepB/Spo0J family partition protein n=1 Tax=Pseudoramibacter sp. TaxID=2034862 RepID=UPI0025D74D47|nr:ParB/RepB/Spo0J family partition protein [Pseudoramibacter sp.]MCH4071925.1 ParB/RepB/Spo0J family partition protein [Pseudoramibacter sp.]MCH4105693.1 ParB/RepB/Spo0J family partition protein [Pseudoramibacter sp.]